MRLVKQYQIMIMVHVIVILIVKVLVHLLILINYNYNLMLLLIIKILLFKIILIKYLLKKLFKAIKMLEIIVVSSMQNIVKRAKHINKKILEIHRICIKVQTQVQLIITYHKRNNK
jgi:F0F1-type ATP synthase membrane subunit b/b'